MCMQFSHKEFQFLRVEESHAPFSYDYAYACVYAYVTPAHTYFSYFSYAYVCACAYAYVKA